MYVCTGALLVSLTFRGENCLHVLARYSKENAPVNFSLLMQTAPGFPIDVQDRDGNTGEQPSVQSVACRKEESIMEEDGDKLVCPYLHHSLYNCECGDTPINHYPYHSLYIEILGGWGERGELLMEDCTVHLQNSY